ncbi:MAG: formylglycine-generating enzyme family protein [Planctomycetota bacterium]
MRSPLTDPRFASLVLVLGSMASAHAAFGHATPWQDAPCHATFAHPAPGHAACGRLGFGGPLQDGHESGDERPSVYPSAPAGQPPAVPVPDTEAATATEMKPYTESTPGSSATFEMLPVVGGEFLMGSPAGEDEREASEGPQHRVTVSPFWMGAREVTWDEYHIFMLRLDQLRRPAKGSSHPQDAWADAVSRPTPPYVPMDFEMGVEGYPAVCMTQFAAKQYCKWLSMKTGRFYRLPTEAEWEYACRAGTTTAYYFGDDPNELEEHAWYFDNGDDSYHLVGLKQPNPWGFYDMHGNVAEWVIDAFDTSYYGSFGDDSAVDPLNWPTTLYPRIVRGGSWDDDPEWLRSAARRKSTKGWKVQDPQLPKSIWYHTDASFIGFRLVRPLVPPSAQERAPYWETDIENIREIQERQRRGDR